MMTAITDKLVLLLATGFYSGYSPKAPGTIGSLVAILPFLLLQQLADPVYAVIVILSLLFGVLICHRADKLLNSHDNKAIVWDEFVGLWITLFMVPSHWLWICIGFLLFRFFDILKPWPISVVDHKVSGGVGVMLDDVIAGLFALSCLQLIIYWNLLPVS